MRRRCFEADRDYAINLLSRAEVVHLATTTLEGEPVFRTLNAVVVKDWILFHGAVAGEKTAALGRSAVISAEEIVASIPSYFVDPERACPATSLYDSAQAHGVIENIEDVDLKAAMLEALMQKYQPEGGYQPLSATHPLYERALRGVLVFGVRLERVAGKCKLGQNRKPEELVNIAERLWQRGAARDVHALQRLFDVNGISARPARFIGPAGELLEPELDAQALPELIPLLKEQYWARSAPAAELRAAHLGSSAWVGARNESGQLIASARAISDGSRHAYLADVIVHPEHRARGLGSRLVEFLLDHPTLRHVRIIRLGTADQQSFYRRLGFLDSASVNFGFTPTAMLRLNPALQHT